MELTEKDTTKIAGQRLASMMDCLVLVSDNRLTSVKAKMTKEEIQAQKESAMARGMTSSDYDMFHVPTNAYIYRTYPKNTIQSGRLSYFQISETVGLSKGYQIKLILNDKIEVMLASGKNEDSFTITALAPTGITF